MSGILNAIHSYLFDSQVLILSAATIGTFVSVSAFLFAFLRSDAMAKRVENTVKRRAQLRAQQLEALQTKSKLRRDTPSRLRKIATALKLERLLVDDTIRAKLRQANWTNSHTLAAFTITRAVLPLGFGGYAILILFGSSAFPYAFTTKLALVLVAFSAGYYLPQIYLSSVVDRRQKAIARALPDSLDLLLICVESGLSIDMAFTIVARETAETSPEMAEELALAAAELTYLPDRRQALENLNRRSGVEDLKAVCTVLIQADKYGTPLSTALRAAASDSRQRRLTMAERKAAALPAKLTVPMILFFLPPLFVVILGPAVLRIGN